MTKPTFTIVHPSRGRAEKARVTASRWLERSTDKNIQYIVSIDTDDPQAEHYKELFPGALVLQNKNLNLIDAVNRAVPHIQNDCMVLVSDDFDCPEQWDLLLGECARGHYEYAIYVNDGISHNRRVMTLPIMSKTLIDRIGYLYYPGYTGMFADNDLYELCNSFGILQRLDKAFVFKHNHYTVDKTVKNDDTYKRHNTRASWDKGKALLADRVRAHYGQPLLEILVPTITKRKDMFDELMSKLQRQVAPFKGVYIMSYCDDGELSIGAKRNKLLESVTGKYCCFVDDDDDVNPHYVNLIRRGCLTDKDCINLNGIITFDGKSPKVFTHSLGIEAYYEKDSVYYRYPNHLNVIRANIAKRFRFQEINHGEDTDWATQIFKSGLLKTQYEVPDTLYYYKYITKK